MTTPVSGSSLPQARDVHQHNHFHNSRDSHSHHYQHTHHNHHHVRSQNSNADSNLDSSKRGHKRTDSDEPTIIVETVSVLQIIDSSGATVTLQTLTPSGATPATTIHPGSDTTTVDPGTESVSDLGFSTTLTATSDDEGDGSSSTTSTPTIDPTVAPSESSMPTSFPTLSYSPLTSTPLSGSPVFPSLAGVTNTTQASSSTSIFPNSTSSTSSALSFSAESVNSSSTPVLSSSSSFFSSSDSSTSATTTTSSESASTTSGSSSSAFASASSTGTGGGDVGLGGNVQPSSSSTSTADGASSSSSDGPGAATVAGSVLGGVAALAFLLILALYVLRWKKRQNTNQLMRGSTSERGDGSGMAEQRRRSIPFAIPAALASLTGHKRISGRSGASSDGGERGFSKVSGRKLPPVIQFGGDGYSDPRDTIMSDQSIDYRDSQAFPGLGSTGPTRLAVGAPMRPESGVPVYNPGPARTPVTGQAPFTPDTSPLEPPPRDPLGPSRPSQDGSSRSHASVSRFTEVL
ncbi:hypothetical protein F4781DRAFT_7118 [Annulohypoxylon bovei var. microspora]|nr:hypothetical protein F4781DRAFT_7118 [Annulohypoxylon bovei var. microspora]